MSTLKPKSPIRLIHVSLIYIPGYLFVSADGQRQVRMLYKDLVGAHGGGPHVNFDILSPKYKSVHVFFFD